MTSLLLGRSHRPTAREALASWSPSRWKIAACLDSPLFLKVTPSLHGDLAGIEFSIFVVASLAGPLYFSSCHTRVAPTEVVEVPVSVHGQDEVPDGQGKEVDEHPEDVGNAMRGDDDEDTGKTEDEKQEDQGNDGRSSVGDGCFESKSDCIETLATNVDV